MLHSERQQIDIGHLARAVDVCCVDLLLIEQTHAIRPEFVLGFARGLSQTYGNSVYRLGIGVTRMRHDAHAAILCDRA